MVDPAQVEAMVERLVAAVADGPQSIEAVVPVVMDDRLDVEAWGAIEAAVDDPRLIALPGERIGSVSALAAGLTLWHRLDDQEATARAVVLGDDLTLLAPLVLDVAEVAIGDDVVGARTALDAEGAPDLDAAPLVGLPVTWEPDLAAGDLVGFVLDDGHLRLVASEAASEPLTDAAGDAFRDAFAAVVDEHAQPLAMGAEDDERPPADAWVLPLEDVALAVLADHGAALRALRAPVVEAIEALGHGVSGSTVVGAGVTPDALLLHDIGRDLLLRSFPDLAPPAATAVRTAVAWRGLTEGEEADDPAVARTLRDPVVAGAVTARMAALADDHLATVARGIERVAALAPRDPGVGLVQGEARLRSGDPVGAFAAVAGVAEGPGLDRDDWSHLIERLGMLQAVAGDIAGAVAAFRRVEADHLIDAVESWRAVPPSGVGRNDPCPCGSGRKFKQCCLVRPPPPALAARVPFLWWKLQAMALELVADAAPVASGPVEEWSGEVVLLTVDAQLVEDGLLARLGALLGPLLPDDERDALAGWTDLRRSVHLVSSLTDTGHVVLRDLVTDATAEVAPDFEDIDLDGPREAIVGEVWLAVVAPVAGEDHLLGSVIAVPLEDQPALAAGLAGSIDGQGLIDLVEAVLDRSEPG